MEESVTGFIDQGTWGDIVEFGERVTRALSDNDVTGSEFDEWNEWRPKSHERLDVDVNEKTAQQASVDESAGEKAGQEPDDDIKAAGEKLTESYKKLEDDTDEAVDKWNESIDYVARAADSAGRKAIRAVEGAVYKNVMTQVAPYYFDNDIVSANLQRIDDDEPAYQLEVNINDDDLRIRVSNALADYEQSVDRWHVDCKKDTEALETVEGGEVSDNGADSRPTTN